MRKSIHFGWYRSVFFFLAFNLLFFTSCEIGLGSSVDTESPVISITYPPSLATIRESFIFSGSWSDDGAIKNISIEVYKSLDNGKQLVHSQNANVAADGTWSAELNRYDASNTGYYNGWEFGDGNYEILVSAMDESGHTSGVSSRSFSIDNTPPVLIITNPTSAGNDATPASFGQIVQLTGTFYDFCGKISNLTVSFYDESGNAICDSDFSNITSMSDASPLVVARYYSDSAQQAENQRIYDNYCAILGASNIASYESGTPIADKKIYFTVTASDDAKVYKVPGDSGTGNGNLSEKFYRGTTSMQNLINGDGVVPDFTLVDFASYKNMTSSAFTSYASSIDSVANAAQSFSTTTTDTPDISAHINNTDSSSGDEVYLNYTINPMNNPNYTVGGFEVITAAQAAADTNFYSPQGFKRNYNGASIPISISVGKDLKNISTHTVSIYRINQTLNNYQNNISTALFTQENLESGLIELLWTWDQSVYAELQSWGKNYSSVYTATSADANVSSLTKQLTVDFPVAGNDYIIYVVGKDITDNEILAVNSNGYGFCGATTTTAATFQNVTGNSLNDIVTKAKFMGTSASSVSDLLCLQGEIVSEENLIGLNYTLTVTDSEDTNRTHTASGTIDSIAGASAVSGLTSSYYYQHSNGAQKVYKWRWTSADSNASDFTLLNTSGAYDVSLVLTANNGASSTFQRTFTVDTKAPELELSDLTKSVEITEDSEYWINPGKELTVEGLVTDNLSTAKACTTFIKLIALSNASTAVSSVYYEPTTPATNVNKWSFTVPQNSIASTYYGAKLQIWAKDKAGNVSEPEEITLRFDSTAPKARHWADANHKDIYFRIGNADNDQVTSSGTTTWETGDTVSGTNNTLNTAVGKKYAYGSWGKDSTIQIRGSFKEEGSGLKLIHYAIFNAIPDASDITAFVNDELAVTEGGKVIAKGSISPVNESKKVPYTKDRSTGAKAAAEVTSNFNEEIPGFNGTSNYLVLVAEDNVGNRAADTLVLTASTNADGTIGSEIIDGTGTNTWNSEGQDSATPQDSAKPYYIINKDTVVPQIESTSLQGGVFTNGQNPVTVSGTASDAASGLKKIRIFIDESGIDYSDEISVSDAQSHENNTWSFTIPGAELSGATSSTITVYAIATDNAGDGNEKQISAATVTIDTTGPTVDINIPSDADTSTQVVDLNGTISLSGTAYDANGIYAVRGLCYKIVDASQADPAESDKPAMLDSVTTAAWNAPDGWTALSATLSDSTATTNWTFQDIDTTGITDGSVVWFTVAVQDKAGNIGYAVPKKFKINQHTDRPVIKFTNLNNVAAAGATTPVYILKFGTNSQLEGNISDDDGNGTSVVDIFAASKTQITTEPADGTGGWAKTINGNEITWSHTFTEAGTSYTETTKYNKTTGDYTYTPPVTGDGEKQIYFYVKDNAGTVFYTAHSTAANDLNNPYLQYKTDTKVNNTTVLDYKSDGTSPTITSVKLQAYTAIASSTTAIGGEVEPGTSVVVGGTKKNKIKFIIKASDANGIKDMNLKYTPVGGSEITISTADNGGTFAETTTSAEATWTTDFIDVSGFDTGSVNVTITANDQSGLFANRNPVFMVDNTEPAINISSPSEADEVTGAVSVAGQATDSGGAGNPTISIIIPTAAQRSAAGTTAAAKTAYYKGLASTAWGGNLHGSSIPSSFEYVFNGDTTNDNASLDIYSKNGGTTYNLTAGTDGLYFIPIWFRSEDALGNVGVKEFTLKYNPDADKPLTEISYPSEANYETGKTYVTLGGSIRVSGSISIPSLTTTPDKVYIQIARESETGVTDIWGNTDKTKAGSGTGNYGYTVKDITAVQNDIGKTVTGLTSAASSAWWGIEAVRSSNAWSFNLNDGGKLNPTSGTVNKIQIRACGVNAEGKMGAWSSPVTIHIDASAPEYSTKLYQFSGTPAAGAQIAEKEYEPGVFLKGQWYIGIHMTDEDKVTFISAKRGDDTLTSADVTSSISADEKTADIFIKLNDDASQTYTVEARDNASGGYHYVYPSYEIKVDNIAPTLSDITAGEGYPIAMTKQRTSNNVITFGATATDAGSGFSRLAYYFKRGSSTAPTIELPLPTVNDAANRKWEVGTKYKSDAEHPLTYNSTDKLFGKELTGTKTATATTTSFAISNADISDYPFIREGGIVKMAGTYHLITGVSGNTVTVNSSIGADVTRAFFPAAFIVDNLSSEGSTWSSGINTIAGDDGDGVVESVRKSGTTWTWDTSIYAGELDDGEVTLVCVAFDVAENCADKETKFMLANKTPRLSKLYLATDLNGDGKYSDDELGTSVITTSGAKTVEKYYSALNAGSLQDVFTVYGNTDDENNSTTDSRITMRDKLGLAFEFVSGYEGYGAGQGDLKYKLSVGSSAITDAETGTTGTLATATDSNYANTTVTAGLTGKKFLELTPAMFTGGTTYGSYTEYKVSSETGYNASTNYLNYLHITLWDSSKDGSGTKDAGESDEDYTNSNGIAATYKKYTGFGDQWTAFNIPLYMDLVDGVKPTVAIDNPVAVTHTTGTGDEAVVVADGHVDLSSTLSSLAGTDEFDSDDKVSGKFKFTGRINDDKRITYINLGVTKKFSDVTVSGTRLATYSTTTGGFKVGTTTTDVVPGTTTIVPASATGLTFKILTSEFSTINGHTVTWELEVDSELVESLAQTDVVFTVTANDGTTANTTNATHQVDIVPYITGLDRPDAKTNTHRSRRGKYQVVLGETINLTGWNLPGTSTGAIKLQVSGQQNKATGTVKESIDSTGKTGASDKHDISFTAPGTSGYIKVVTSGVSSVNNFNTGNAMESEYSGDEWYDDIYLNVWKNDEYFYFSNDPISPSMDRIKYNNTNGDARYRLYGGWATQSSKFYASYPNTSGSGSTGNAPSPATGNSNTSKDSQTFGDPATFYDVAIDGQNRYNVLVDCWQGSTDGWGRNFVINYNGWYSHNGCNAGTGSFNNSNSGNMRHVIERMGGCGTAPDNANSSDGFDEIFNQFLNPRITVYDGEAYITYYDRYAKCLKWAMSKPSAANNTIAKKYATEGIWNDNTYQTNAADSNNKSAYYKNGGFVVAGYDTLQSGGSQTNLNVGMWSDIAIDTTAGKPVIAYYDSTNRQLMIATSASATYPVNTNSPVLTGTATSATQGNAWTRQIVTGSTALRLGEYLSLALDGGNNIHIACKSAKEGALYYVYGARTAYGSYTWTTVCVDKNGSPGNWTDIKLTNPGSSGAAAGPVISYYDPTNDASEDALKVAYLESTTSNAAANWDNMTVPCNTAAIANRITLALDVTDGASIASQATTTNNSKLAVGYVSSRFDCVYLRKE